MAFRHVRDYWVFQEAAESDLFKWRSELELLLDKLHDATAAIAFPGCSPLEDDLARRRQWTEDNLGRSMSEQQLADLRRMLSVRGALQKPTPR